MKTESKFNVPSRTIAIEVAKETNSVTWSSKMDILKGRAKRGDDESLLYWLDRLTQKSVTRGIIGIELSYVIIDTRNRWFNDEILTLNEIKEMFNCDLKEHVISMLIHNFFHKKDCDFDMQFEIIQDILLYNKILSRNL